jgi:hypothetical protein
LVNKKIITRVFIIFSFFSFISLQSCYIFCLFRPENRLEEILEQLVEEEIEMLLDESAPSKETASATGSGT